MKALIYLIVSAAIAYGAYYSYENYYDKVTGEFVFPWSKDTEEQVIEEKGNTKEFEVKTRQCVVVTRDGRKLYKTYSDTASYSYAETASAKEKMALKKAAHAEVMKTLIAEATLEKERISQFLSYYKETEKHLRTIANASFVKIDEDTLKTIKELRAKLRKTSDKYRMLSKEEELEKEASLTAISSSLLRNQKNKKIKEIAKEFSSWYSSRLDNYPEVNNVLALYRGHRVRK